MTPADTRWPTHPFNHTSSSLPALAPTLRAGPQAASQLLMTCPHIMSVFPDRVAGVVEAAAPRLGVSSQEVLGLFVKRPEVLMRHPEKVKESAGALVQLLGGNKAAAVQLLKKQPSLLLFTSEGLEGERQGWA